MIRGVVAAMLLWQAAVVTSNDPVAEPKYMAWKRAVTVPAGAAGQACAVLDASVFAHASGESLNDLRLFAGGAAVPFALTESGTQRVEDEEATVRNLGMQGGEVVFDLEMPAGAYTAVALTIAAKDFVGTAKVWGVEAGGQRVELGSFAVFDLSAQRLARSTVLGLQESTFAELHVALHMEAAPGMVRREFGADVVEGASVPPSREAQTVYTTVAETAKFVRRGRETVAVIGVPAHVPVERVTFEVDPKFEKNFLRGVTVTARPIGGGRDDAEVLRGEISRVRMVEERIDSREMSVEAALGANLKSAAKVEIVVENGDDEVLPLTSIQLEIRQRKMCFEATGGSYELMYGDGALRAPVYDYARLFVGAVKPVVAVLGGEEKNGARVERADTRPYTERHPELLWVVLLAAVGVLGSVALRGARRQGRHG